MTTVFADTFYYLALLNPRDDAHEKAVQASEKLSRLLITSYVLLEIADAFAAPIDRPCFLRLADRLRNDPAVTIVPSSEELFQRGVELYRRRADKGWPLTDCISFVVMRDHGVRAALTGDQHFKQAGFTPLLLTDS